DLDRREPGRARLVDRRQLDHPWRDERRGHHEDDEQHEHHVDIGHDVDLVHRPALGMQPGHYGRAAWRCRMLENSSMKLSKRIARRWMSCEKRLYATTAGIAAKRPIAVATSASAMPGATCASVACATLERLRKACIIPHTVPKRPTYGLTEPVEARKARWR